MLKTVLTTITVVASLGLVYELIRMCLWLLNQPDDAAILVALILFPVGMGTVVSTLFSVVNLIWRDKPKA